MGGDGGDGTPKIVHLPLKRRFPTYQGLCQCSAGYKGLAVPNVGLPAPQNGSLMRLEPTSDFCRETGPQSYQEVVLSHKDAHRAGPPPSRGPV